MRAVVVDRYGGPEVARVRTVPDPVPRRGEVLVRICAAAVSSGDARMRGARFPRGMALPARLALGLRGPRRGVLGAALAGPVVDPGTSGFTVGERVAGTNGVRVGAHAELAAVRASGLAAVPDTVSDVDAAAAVFGGTTALHFLRDRVREGDRVLVTGAAGSVGSAGVQLAVDAGAEVTALTADPALATRLGAKVTLARDARLVGPYDVVLDAVGTLGRRGGLPLCAADGWVLLPAADLGDLLRARGRVVAGPAPERAADVAHLLDLVAAGRLDPLAEVLGGLDAVAEAHRRIDSGRKVGNLVVLPAD